jgi:hypothetical protein
MDAREERKRRLAEAADESAKVADAMLENRLKALKAATRTDLEKLKPQVADTATYNKLIAVIEESTRKNESLAQLKDRVHALGKEVVGMVKQVTTLL